MIAVGDRVTRRSPPRGLRHFLYVQDQFQLLLRDPVDGYRSTGQHPHHLLLLPDSPIIAKTADAVDDENVAARLIQHSMWIYLTLMVAIAKKDVSVRNTIHYEKLNVISSSDNSSTRSAIPWATDAYFLCSTWNHPLTRSPVTRPPFP